MTSQVVGAIDMGGTKTALALVRGDGRVVRRTRFDTPPRPSPAAFLDRVAAEWARLVAEDGGVPVAAVGVAAPGPSDAVAGVLHQVFDWPWRDVPVAAALGARLGLPVSIENDVNCCALAERGFGAAVQVADFAWVQVSTGVGGALFLGGRLYRGASGLAGEIGHLELDENGPRCACGRRGCLQALISGPAIARRYAEATGGERAVMGDAPPAVSTAEVFARASGEDRVARGVIAGVATDLGRGLALLVNLLNPALVVVGGGVLASLAAHLPAVQRAMRDRVIGSANAAVPVVPSAVGYDAALLGAAALALAAAPRDRQGRGASWAGPDEAASPGPRSPGVPPL